MEKALLCLMVSTMATVLCGMLTIELDGVQAFLRKACAVQVIALMVVGICLIFTHF